MKKYLALLLAIVFCLGCFAACGEDDATTDTTDPNAATLAEAVTYLQSLYKDAAANTPHDYDMPAKVMIGTTQFTVTWSVNVDKITIKESSMSGFWTVDVPNKNDTEFKYVLTATVKDSAGKTQEISFNRVMPVVNNDGSTELVEGKEYKMYMIQVTVGKVLYATADMQDEKYLKTTEDASKAILFKVEKVEGGYKIYTEIEGVKNYIYAHTVPYEDGSGKFSKYLCYSAENASVWSYQKEVNAWFTTCADGTTYVMGTYSSFETFCISESTYINATNSGVTQFPAEFLEADKDAPELPKPDSNDPAADSTLSIKDAIALGASKISDQYTQGKYYVEGVITEVYNEQYGNMKISDGDGNILTIYGTYSADGSTRYDAMDVKPVAGDTVKVYGIIGQFKDTPQMKNGWIVESTATGGEQGGTDTPDTPDTPTIGVITAPVAGTAYQFGMVQGNLNKTYYLAGGMDGYYMATTTDAAKAIDVYLEETTGGYYLYTMVDGTKTYINMVVSGTHVNGAYETTASTVYTWNAEKNTIVSAVEGADYWFGTRNDKTYTTVGPVKVEYDGFYCQFYGEGGTVVTPDPKPETKDEPETTTTISVVSAPVAGTAYKFGMVQGNLNKTYYLAGGMDGYYMATTTDVAKAIDVYLEETSGGYYLYTMVDGVKTYINMVVSGTHVNGAYEATASSVYTWDAENKTIISVVNDADYWFGTRNDKTYTTVGPCATSYNGFFCQFYA